MFVADATPVKATYDLDARFRVCELNSARSKEQAALVVPDLIPAVTDRVKLAPTKGTSLHTTDVSESQTLASHLV